MQSPSVPSSARTEGDLISSQMVLGIIAVPASPFIVRCETARETTPVAVHLCHLCSSESQRETGIAVENATIRVYTVFCGVEKKLIHV